MYVHQIRKSLVWTADRDIHSVTDWRNEETYWSVVWGWQAEQLIYTCVDASCLEALFLIRYFLGLGEVDSLAKLLTSTLDPTPPPVSSEINKEVMPLVRHWTRIGP